MTYMISLFVGWGGVWKIQFNQNYVSLCKKDGSGVRTPPPSHSAGLMFESRAVLLR
jgi:hypothetical protein